jgi:hypothetical protein
MNRAGKQEAEAAALAAWWCGSSPSGRKGPHDYGFFFVADRGKMAAGVRAVVPDLSVRFGLAGHVDFAPQKYRTWPVMAWDAGSAKYRSPQATSSVRLRCRRKGLGPLPCR